MEILQKFLFLFKSKYRRKWTYRLWIVVYTTFVTCSVLVSHVSGLNTSSSCGGGGDFVCYNGDCLNNTCICRPGWAGPNCQFCYGKIRVLDDKGWISDGPGNYTSNMKCTWLIESHSMSNELGNTSTMSNPPSINLHISEFATECGWDHLYVYDGDNVHAPLLGVFSGILVQRQYKVLRLPEIVAKSGYALLHFYTDVAYNLTGFNISYRTRSCPSDDPDRECSGNGVCLDGICTCNAKYSGEACNVEKCPNNCSNQGFCNMELHKCQCKDGYRGRDCSQKVGQGFWEVIPSKSSPRGTASHAAVVHNHSLWVFGGNSLDLSTTYLNISRFDFSENRWYQVKVEGDVSPPAFYGHSCVVFDNKIFLYGGVHDGIFGNRFVSHHVWSFDMISRTWSQVSVKPSACKRKMCGPLSLAGHTAVVINDKGKNRHNKMVVLLGHSPRYGFVNVVQEFHFASSVWNIANTKGHPVGGSYGHSSSWDPASQRIYVYGGYRVGPDSAYLSSSMLAYDPTARTWSFLRSGPGGRFLHASVVSKGLVMVIGGNGHNDTTYSLGSKCFTRDVLVYDIACDSWSTMTPSADIPADLDRYGHSASSYQDSVYIYGGFNGFVLNDLIQFSPPICEALDVDSSCTTSRRQGVKCIWNKLSGKCEPLPLASLGKDKDNRDSLSWLDKCSEDKNAKHESGQSVCENFWTCTSCLKTDALQKQRNCVWCGNLCQYSKCKDDRSKALVSFENCPADDVCGLHLHNCPLCTSEPNCVWGKDEQCQKEVLVFRNATDIPVEKEPTCDLRCSDYMSCSNCTSNSCMWCNNLSTCVDKNAYITSFPYGQCMSWSQAPNLCLSRDPHAISTSICDEVASCDTCLSLPSCGWCDSGTGTGLGQCMDGSGRGALNVNSTGAHLNLTLCPIQRWHFTSCPACQCNGHSKCDENNKCRECDSFTQGEHCQVCIPGYYGTAINGGTCRPCECNNQADTCNPETGRCYCTTKGITGEDCGRCDTQSNYAGDPTNGSCFYELQIDYQFTFNLSKKDDLHYTKINFRNSPTKPDVDAEFQITCSVLAKMNITFSKAGGPEKVLLHDHNCTTFKSRFTKTEYTFGDPDNTTFFVYLYEFQPPLWIQISFSQSPKLDLLHFFITFSTCFLLLLLVAAVLWKIKQKYDMYRRRQRMFVEMDQMAKRPFAQVYVEVDKTLVTSRILSTRKRRKEWPSPIALEPCHGNRAAVLSLLIALPTGSQGFAPSGQPGLAVGSALVSLGNPRKVSFEPINKTEGKNSKIRKSLPSHSLNTCI